MEVCEILVVDDDCEDVEFLVDAFHHIGVEGVHHVYTAKEALAYLHLVEQKNQMPKLIIIDMFLGGISETEFITVLKSMDEYRHIPIIVFSGSQSPRQMLDNMKSGALKCIVKPCCFDHYIAVAQEIKNELGK